MYRGSLCCQLLAQEFSRCVRRCELLTQGLGGLLLVDRGRAPAAADEAREPSPMDGVHVRAYGQTPLVGDPFEPSDHTSTRRTGADVRGDQQGGFS